VRAEPQLRRRGLVATALAAAGSWLLEPAEPRPAPDSPPAVGPRPVVAVFGLARRCGATTLARALGAELASRTPEGACAVAGTDPPGAIPLGTPAAGRLARALAAFSATRPRPCGRLCLLDPRDPLSLADVVRDLAPLVLDAGTAPGGAFASVADRVVLVASPAVEPALATAVAASVSRVAARPLVVLSRAPGGEGSGSWSARADLVVPEARAGAQLALGGRDPRGALGRALCELADRCEAA